MTYRHSDHAGNHGDCLKHSLLAWLLNHLSQNTAEHLIYLESHAGDGRYHIDASRSEHLAQLHLDPPNQATPYLESIAAINSDSNRIVAYPGSPTIAAQQLKSTDHLKLVEHSTESTAQLRTHFNQDSRVELFETDGFITLPYLLGQVRYKGIALIDPPYAEPSEQKKISQTLHACLGIRSDFMLAIWYPLIDGERPELFNSDHLTPKGVPKSQIELNIPHQNCGMSGSGMLVINPPIGYISASQILLGWLNRTIAEGVGEITLI